ncbi:MAG: S41 family peptidase [Oscillospiraceae bacterium]|nr:S41 family peptidase [Oscillospiraceae bacterium]
MKRMKYRKKLILTAILSSVTATLVTGSLFIYSSMRYQQNRDELYNYFEVKDYIEKYYYKDPDDESYMDNALKGLVAGLGDDYAAYMTPEEYNSNMQSLQGSFAGIGVTITENEAGEFVVVEIVEDSPAAEADIKVDDLIVKVSDVPTNNMDINQLVSLVKGEENTDVTIRIKRGEKEHDVTLTRKTIKDNTVEYTMLENNIAYIKIMSFKDVTTEQFETAFNTAFKDGAEKVIYDLRNNGGGTLTSCEAMLDPLLPEGAVAYAEFRDGESEVICRSDANEVDVPTVILVNENSASASELFASAMRDFEKAELVGTKTFGKGIMQTTIGLSNKGGLRLTTAAYRTAKSECFHGVGLVPDYEVELPENTDISKPDPEKDPQLKKALELLK